MLQSNSNKINLMKSSQPWSQTHVPVSSEIESEEGHWVLATVDWYSELGNDAPCWGIGLISDVPCLGTCAFPLTVWGVLGLLLLEYRQIAISRSFRVISLLAFNFFTVKESWNLEIMMVMGKARTTIPNSTTKLPVSRPNDDLKQRNSDEKAPQNFMSGMLLG